MRYIYTMEYNAGTKRVSHAICSNTEGPRDDHILCEMSQRVRPCDVTSTWHLKYDTSEEMIILREMSQRVRPCDVTSTWNLKYDTSECIDTTKTDLQHREQTCDCQGGG